MLKRMTVVFLLVSLAGVVAGEGEERLADLASKGTHRIELAAPQVSLDSRSNARVYKIRIEPRWFEDGDRFWYRNELRGGACEYILVDAVQGERKRAFDHQRLGDALREAGVTEAQPDRLPIEDIQFGAEQDWIWLRAAGKHWRCNLATYELSAADPSEIDRASSADDVILREIPRASARGGPETALEFVNQTELEVELFWLDEDGDRQSYGKLGPDGKRSQHTYAGHVWLAVNTTGTTIAAFQAAPSHRAALITGNDVPRERRPPRRRFRRATASAESPDGKWHAFLRDDNIYLRAVGGEDELQLTKDGTAERGYRRIQWSPDSQTLAAYRVTASEPKEVYRIESSPTEGGRAVLHSRGYPLPGDEFPSHELNLFRLESTSDTTSRWRSIRPNVEPVDFGWPSPRWNRDGSKLTYFKVDRGHQRYRLIEVHSQTGASRELIDEQTDTFIWTMHAENVDVRPITWMEKTDELIYASEVDGWRHLYLVDVAHDGDDKATGVPTITSGQKTLYAPGLRNQITRGEFVVRGVDEIDEERRQIWFHAGGRNKDQDPYFLHYYRVSFDGTDLVALTEGDGDHSIQYSPDRRFLIDTYSRVDMPPVHELRRVDDGSLICSLEAADASELEDTDWRSPEVFVAKGRDGQTDIWGMISWPDNYDPTKKYPVIEALYAGPHSAYVPKRFSSRNRYADLNALGFIVVKIDGMGTAHRSKAFHDVCWHNLKDAGFEDRILWMKAAAEKYSSMDLDRVGVYGVSAGGQNAAAAVLFHGDFYKVAVAGCGCHDNRMDKSSWNEQWMGYPVGPQYAESSNVDNAHRLRGKLFLIVGEMDNNVPPESTLRFVDALIKADKDFDMLFVPGAGHGMGGDYGWRRMREFLVRHLQNTQQDSE